MAQVGPTQPQRIYNRTYLFPSANKPEEKRENLILVNLALNLQILFKINTAIYRVIFGGPVSIEFGSKYAPSPNLYWYGGIFDDSVSHTEQFCILSHRTAQCSIYALCSGLIGSRLHPWIARPHQMGSADWKNRPLLLFNEWTQFLSGMLLFSIRKVAI